MKAIRIISSVMLCVLVLGLSSVPASISSVRSLMADSAWLTRGTATQVMILAVSLVLILCFSRGNLTRYGFRRSTIKQIKAAFLFGSIAAVTVHVLLAVLWKLLSLSENQPVIAGSSFVQIVISVWILASISEEMLFRSLIQSFLGPLREHGVSIFGIRLSLPVLIAALLFGLVHIMLLTTGADIYFIAGIVSSAVVLGIVAGYYREKSGSLLPAILVHMLFNAYGGAVQYIQQLVFK